MASLCWLLTSICSFLRIILLLDDAARFEPFFFFFFAFFYIPVQRLEPLFLITICETDSDGVHWGKVWCGPSTFGIGQALSIVYVVALLVSSSKILIEISIQ